VSFPRAFSSKVWFGRMPWWVTRPSPRSTLGERVQQSSWSYTPYMVDKGGGWRTTGESATSHATSSSVDVCTTALMEGFSRWQDDLQVSSSEKQKNPQGVCHLDYLERGEGTVMGPAGLERRPNSQSQSPAHRQAKSHNLVVAKTP